MRLSELYTIMVNKVTFVGFGGGDRPNRPALDPFLCHTKLFFVYHLQLENQQLFKYQKN